MALIFFEGFNRTFATTDPANQWTMTTVASTTPVFGASSNVRTGAGCLSLPTNNGNGVDNQCYVELANFGTQANKTIYLGFASYQIYTSYSAATANYAAKFLRFYAADGSEVFRIDVDKSPAATDTIGFTFKNSSGTTLGTFIVDNAANHGSYANSRGISTGGTYNGLWGYDSWNGYYYWPYVELKFVFSSTATGTAELRVGGVARQTSGGATTITLPTIANIAKIRFCGNETAAVTVDDLYILDSTGADLNSWLGAATKVFSPTLQSTNDDVTSAVLQEWETVGTLSLSSHDPDSDYLKTKLVDKKQLYVLNSSDNLFSISAYEKIAAVQIRSTARETSLPAAYKHIFKPTVDGTFTDISTELQTATFYQSNTNIMTVVPGTTTDWSVTALETAHFGIQSVPRT